MVADQLSETSLLYSSSPATEMEELMESWIVPAKLNVWESTMH
jgi:hypothetical protein